MPNILIEESTLWKMRAYKGPSRIPINIRGRLESHTTIIVTCSLLLKYLSNIPFGPAEAWKKIIYDHCNPFSGYVPDTLPQSGRYMGLVPRNIHAKTNNEWIIIVRRRNCDARVGIIQQRYYCLWINGPLHCPELQQQWGDKEYLSNSLLLIMISEDRCD